MQNISQSTLSQKPINVSIILYQGSCNIKQVCRFIEQNAGRPAKTRGCSGILFITKLALSIIDKLFLLKLLSGSAVD